MLDKQYANAYEMTLEVNCGHVKYKRSMYQVR